MKDSPRHATGHVGLVLARRLPGLSHRARGGEDEDVVHVARVDLLSTLRFFRDDPDLALEALVDLTAIDYGPARAAGRFEVVYRLRSPRLGYRVRLAVDVEEDDATVPSAVGLLPAADWYERELWDLFGIYADGHPYLRRLLLYPGFSGHPLRRDYPAGKSQPLVPLREGERTCVEVNEGD